MSGDSKLSEEEYDELLKPLAKELSAMARWVAETGQRMVIVFEGRDTAGKGGSIEMFSRVLNPRQCRVVALPSPGESQPLEWDCGASSSARRGDACDRSLRGR